MKTLKQSETKWSFEPDLNKVDFWSKSWQTCKTCAIEIDALKITLVQQLIIEFVKKKSEATRPRYSDSCHYGRKKQRRGAWGERRRQIIDDKSSKSNWRFWGCSARVDFYRSSRKINERDKREVKKKPKNN